MIVALKSRMFIFYCKLDDFMYKVRNEFNSCTIKIKTTDYLNAMLRRPSKGFNFYLLCHFIVLVYRNTYRFLGHINESFDTKIMKVMITFCSEKIFIILKTKITSLRAFLKQYKTFVLVHTVLISNCNNTNFSSHFTEIQVFICDSPREKGGCDRDLSCTLTDRSMSSHGFDIIQP